MTGATTHGPVSVAAGMAAITPVAYAGTSGAITTAFASAGPSAGKTGLNTPPDLAIWRAGVGRTWSSPTRSDPEGSSRNDFAAGRSGSHLRFPRKLVDLLASWRTTA